MHIETNNITSATC